MVYWELTTAVKLCGCARMLFILALHYSHPIRLKRILNKRNVNDQRIGFYFDISLSFAPLALHFFAHLITYINNKCLIPLWVDVYLYTSAIVCAILCAPFAIYCLTNKTFDTIHYMANGRRNKVVSVFGYACFFCLTKVTIETHSFVYTHLVTIVS